MMIWAAPVKTRSAIEYFQIFINLSKLLLRNVDSKHLKARLLMVFAETGIDITVDINYHDIELWKICPHCAITFLSNFTFFFFYLTGNKTSKTQVSQK